MATKTKNSSGFEVFGYIVFSILAAIGMVLVISKVADKIEPSDCYFTKIVGETVSGYDVKKVVDIKCPNE